MVDAIDHVEWENLQDEIRELKTPMIIIEAGPGNAVPKLVNSNI